MFFGSLEESLELDKSDTLNRFREEFHIPLSENKEEEIYFCGNSLGLQPRTTKALMEEELNKWASNGVKGHFTGKHPWMPYHEFVSESLASVVGAKPHEVIAMNTLTVNLHLMMVSFFRPTKTRFKIVIEKGAFPSDHFAIASQLKFHGLNPVEAMICLEPDDGDYVSVDSIKELFEKEKNTIALVLLPGVQYYTGQLYDIEGITKIAKSYGAVVGFDLAHAAGNVALNLHDWDVDFAVWCHYKYLNSGPGAIAGCYVNEKYHNDRSLPRFEGWWGQDKETRFKMENIYNPLKSAEAWQLSNPAITSLVCLRASLEVFMKAGLANLQDKSEKLTNYLEFLIFKELNDSIHIITNKKRGAQLSLKVSNRYESCGHKIYEELLEANITVDWRHPDVIRVAPVPLYNTFHDVFMFVQVLKGILNVKG